LSIRFLRFFRSLLSPFVLIGASIETSGPFQKPFVSFVPSIFSKNHLSTTIKCTFSVDYGNLRYLSCYQFHFFCVFLPSFSFFARYLIRPRSSSSSSLRLHSPVHDNFRSVRTFHFHSSSALCSTLIFISVFRPSSLILFTLYRTQSIDFSLYRTNLAPKTPSLNHNNPSSLSHSLFDKFAIHYNMFEPAFHIKSVVLSIDTFFFRCLLICSVFALFQVDLFTFASPFHQPVRSTAVQSTGNNSSPESFFVFAPLKVDLRSLISSLSCLASSTAPPFYMVDTCSIHLSFALPSTLSLSQPLFT
jgi:hypothetical protein